MEDCHAHQLILPTDKRNPCFSLYATEDGTSIQVYYGVELLEVVPDDPEHPTFKMMVRRLANAGMRIATLEEVFTSTLLKNTYTAFLCVLISHPWLPTAEMVGF